MARTDQRSYHSSNDFNEGGLVIIKKRRNFGLLCTHVHMVFRNSFLFYVQRSQLGINSLMIILDSMFIYLQ